MKLVERIIEFVQPEEYSELNEVIKNLYITNYYTANNEELLKSYNIKNVVSLYPNLLSQDFNQLYIEIDDVISANIEQYFQKSYDFIDKALENGERVVVHCHMGISRSSSIVIYYLMKKFGIPYEKAYNFLKTKRYIIQPNLGFVKQLLNADEKLKYI